MKSEILHNSLDWLIYKLVAAGHGYITVLQLLHFNRQHAIRKRM
jgi:hypothetical protein